MADEIDEFLKDFKKLYNIYDTAAKLAGPASWAAEAKKAAEQGTAVPKKIVIGADEVSQRLKRILGPVLGRAQSTFELYKKIYYWNIGEDLTDDQRYQLGAIQDALLTMLREKFEKDTEFSKAVAEKLTSLTKIFEYGQAELTKSIEATLAKINTSFAIGSGLDLQQLISDDNVWAMRYIERIIAADDIDKNIRDDFIYLKREVLQYKQWKDFLEDAQETTRHPLDCLIYFYDEASRHYTTSELKAVPQEKKEELRLYRIIINLYEKVRAVFHAPEAREDKEDKSKHTEKPKPKYY